jgi:putative membrane protein
MSSKTAYPRARNFAWVRTGIAIIVFGFVVEKFNLFSLALANSAEVDRSIRTERLAGPFGRYEGLAVMVVGIIPIVAGGVRFVRTSRAIDANALEMSGGVRIEIIITFVRVVLVVAYFVYVLLG